MNKVTSSFANPVPKENSTRNAVPDRNTYSIMALRLEEFPVFGDRDLLGLYKSLIRPLCNGFSFKSLESGEYTYAKEKCGKSKLVTTYKPDGIAI
jgi:hypothetical protein